MLRIGSIRCVQRADGHTTWRHSLGQGIESWKAGRNGNLGGYGGGFVNRGYGRGGFSKTGTGSSISKRGIYTESYSEGPMEACFYLSFCTAPTTSRLILLYNPTPKTKPHRRH